MQTPFSEVAALDELLYGEIIYALEEAEVQVEQWRVYYYTVMPHSSPGYRLPASQAVSPVVTPASATQP